MTAENVAPGSRPRTPAELVDQRAVNSASSSVTGMTMFVASEAVFFAAFFGVYATSYAAATTWPPRGVSAPSLALPTVGLVVLLASGFTMTRCLRRIYRSDYPQGVLPWLLATLVGAIAFAALVAFSLTDVGFGIDQGIYESLFYVLVGLELAHGIGGGMLLVLVLVRAGTGELELRRDPIQATAIYWYFVVALGVAIYAVLYLAVQ